MQAWSIGFVAKEPTHLDPRNWMGGMRIDKWELLEYSAVLVPDNPEALTMLRGKDVDEDTLTAAQHVPVEADLEKIEKARLAAAQKTAELAKQPASQPR